MWIKTHILNTCSSLYVNYSSIKLKHAETVHLNVPIRNGPLNAQQSAHHFDSRFPSLYLLGILALSRQTQNDLVLPSTFLLVMIRFLFQQQRNHNYDPSTFWLLPTSLSPFSPRRAALHFYRSLNEYLLYSFVYELFFDFLCSLLNSDPAFQAAAYPPSNSRSPFHKLILKSREQVQPKTHC